MPKVKAKAKKEVNKVRVVTPIGRINFPNLANKDTGRRYSQDNYNCQVIFQKDTWKEEGKELRAAVLKVAQTAVGPETTLKDIHHPFRNGDEKPDKEYLKGTVYITIKSDFEPAVVGADKTAFDKDRIRQIKGGDYVRCVVTAFPYNNEDGDGVSLGLEVVQFVKEGKSFGGGRAVGIAMLDEVEVDLEDIDEEETEEEEEDETASIPKSVKPAKTAKAEAPKKRGRPAKVVEEEEEDDSEVEEDSAEDDGDDDILL